MLSTWINAGRFFGFHTKVIWDKDNNSGLIQTADGQSFIKMRRNKDDDSDVRVFIHGGDCWVKIQDIPRNQNRIEEYKVLLPRSGNHGSTII
jgi:site-specific DNA-methyltransferase (adenine-specific)